MLDDKQRWNEKYRSCPMPTHVTPTVGKFAAMAKRGRALDIACGKGRHTTYLANQGYAVDAVDISDYALSCIAPHDNITTIEADFDTYVIEPGRYDLIVNCYYLDRRLFQYIKHGLAPGGIMVFETYLETEDEGCHQPSNPDYLLRRNELLHTFIGLEVLYYEEYETVNMRNEKVKVASLAARRS